MFFKGARRSPLARSYPSEAGICASVRLMCFRISAFLHQGAISTQWDRPRCPRASASPNPAPRPIPFVRNLSVALTRKAHSFMALIHTATDFFLISTVACIFLSAGGCCVCCAWIVSTPQLAKLTFTNMESCPLTGWFGMAPSWAYWNLVRCLSVCFRCPSVDEVSKGISLTWDD